MFLTSCPPPVVVSRLVTVPLARVDVAVRPIVAAVGVSGCERDDAGPLASYLFAGRDVDADLVV